MLPPTATHAHRLWSAAAMLPPTATHAHRLWSAAAMLPPGPAKAVTPAGRVPGRNGQPYVVSTPDRRSLSALHYVLAIYKLQNVRGRVNTTSCAPAAVWKRLFFPPHFRLRRKCGGKINNVPLCRRRKGYLTIRPRTSCKLQNVRGGSSAERFRQ